MMEQILQYVSHPFAAILLGFLAVVAMVALLSRLLQSRRQSQNIELKKYISHHVEDEMVGIRGDISVVIENELAKLKRRIPALINENMAKLKDTVSIDPDKKVIDFSKNRSIRAASDSNAFKTDKNDKAPIEKRIDKLDRNMSILMALLVELKHSAQGRKQGSPQDNAKEKLTLKL